MKEPAWARELAAQLSEPSRANHVSLVDVPSDFADAPLFAMCSSNMLPGANFDMALPQLELGILR